MTYKKRPSGRFFRVIAVLWCIPESKRVQAPFGARIQMVQKVQRVVVAALPQIKKGARLRRGLCRRVAPHRGNDSL